MRAAGFDKARLGNTVVLPLALPVAVPRPT
jgi:hypothetical protein